MGKFDRCMRAMDVAEADADFRALSLAYRCGGPAPLFGMIRDRLLDLGVEGVGLDYVMNQVYWSHPSRVGTQGA